MNNGSMNILSNRPQKIRVLYVGRKRHVVEEVANVLAPHSDTIGGGDTTGDTTDSERPEGGHIEFATARNQKSARVIVRAAPPHIILVEVDNKPHSRLRFCESLRYQLPTAAIVAVCAGEPNTPFAFTDVINLPVDALAAKRTLQRCIHELDGHQLHLGHIRLDLAGRTVHTHSGEHHMTPKQCALLNLLMQNHNTVVARSEIMKTIWNTSYMDDTRTLDVHIRWLRERIEPEPSNPIYLTTVRGIGYCLCVESAHAK